MDPITIMAIGAAAGGGLGYFQGEEQKRKERRDTALAAEMARWSPWTGMQPTPIGRANASGNIGQGAMTGLAMGQNINQMNAYSDWLKAQDAKAAAPAAAPAAQPAMTDIPTTTSFAHRGRPIMIDEYGNPIDMTQPGGSPWLKMNTGAP